MEAQILSGGINAAGIPVVSALTEESMTVGEMVLRKNGLKHALLRNWIRVEPWNELLCGSTAVDHGKDQENGVINGDFGRENEALQVKELNEKNSWLFQTSCVSSLLSLLPLHYF